MIFLNFVDMDKSRLYGYCGCLRFVFSFLREHTDWAFWWNLTPDLEEKLHGLDAWHVQEYENLRRQFQEEGWGIFDTSERYVRAIAWTDVYYGDVCPLLWLFRDAGRPVMAQTLEQQREILYDPGIEEFLTIAPVGMHCKEEYGLPPGWEAARFAGKKIVLYHMDTRRALVYSRMLLEKLRDVLAAFREREDIILWWLVEPALQSMLSCLEPAVGRDYAALCRQYLVAGWGVYDDTMDFVRAVSWGDAYYGDPGLPQWGMQELRRPCMIQDYSIEAAETVNCPDLGEAD